MWLTCTILYLWLSLAHASEHDVVKSIFVDYNKNLRPVRDSNTQLIVDITPVLTWIIDVLWNDEFLRWDPDLFDGTVSIRLPITEIWSPDIKIQNGNKVTYIIPPQWTNAVVTYEGNVTVEFLQEVRIRCKYNLRQFPFDRQTCHPKIGSWSYPESELRLDHFEPTFGLKLVTVNPEWTIIDPMTYPKYFLNQYAYDPRHNRSLQELHYNITIERNPSFYVSTLVIPSFIITVVCIIGVFSPTNSNGIQEEKVTLGLTTLLSMAVLLNIITTEMPKSNEGLPLLGRFMLFEMILSAVSTGVAVVLLGVHERAITQNWRVPIWLGKKRHHSSIKIRPTVKNPRKKATLASIFSVDNAKDKRMSAPEQPSQNGKSYHQLVETDVLPDIRSTIHKINQMLEKKTDDEHMAALWTAIFDLGDLFCLCLFTLVNIIGCGIMLYAR